MADCGCGVEPELLEAARKAMGLTFRELARELGLSTRYTFELCREAHRPHRTRVKAALQGWLERSWQEDWRRRQLLRAGLYIN